VDPDLIEPVDFVWTGGALSDPVPTEHRGTFDAFIASHVIEHTPDLVAFLRTAETLLKPDGRVILAIPDKRVCFDYYRPSSTIGDVLEAHRQQRTRHSTKTLWDHRSHQVVKRLGRPGWSRFDQTETRFVCNFAEAKRLADRADSNEYVDAHAWVFVPASFELIILQLARLGLVDWQVERTEAAPVTEFYAWLRRGGQAAAMAMTEAEFSQVRLRLLDAMLVELFEQSQQLPANIASRTLQRRATPGTPNGVVASEPRQSDPALLPFDIEFGIGGNAQAYQVAGWCNPEPGFTWTLGKESSLVLPCASTETVVLTLSAGPFTDPASLPAQRLTVIADGTEVAALILSRLDRVECTIPASVRRTKGPITITFQHPDAARPCALFAGNPDQRELAVAFRRISLRPLPDHGVR
jgi:SAM-dependent methyltransferase